MRAALIEAFRNTSRKRCGSRGHNKLNPQFGLLESRLVLSTPSLTIPAGGLVIQHYVVEPIFVGDYWEELSLVDSEEGDVTHFLDNIVRSSPYLDGLAQYGVSSGSTTAAVFVPHAFPNSTSNLTDDQVAAYGQAQIKKKAPLDAQFKDSTYVYFIYTPPGVVVTWSNGENSQKDFLGYHSARGSFYYAVLPYPGSPNAKEPVKSNFDSLTITTSHELTEILTDPDCKTGWLDRSQKDLVEVGDLCENDKNHVYPSGSIHYAYGYELQDYWSNYYDARSSDIAGRLIDNPSLLFDHRCCIPPERSLSLAGESTFLVDMSVTGISQPNYNQYNGVVATFVDGRQAPGPINQDPGRYTITLDWGDGTHSVGSAVFNKDHFDITGFQNYSLKAGSSITVTVTVKDNTNGQVALDSESFILKEVPFQGVKLINGSGNAIEAGSNAVIGNQMLFIANDGMYGDQLWKSDGTYANTSMVSLINPDGNALSASESSSGSKDYPPIVAMAGAVYFIADDGQHGKELWKSDGTASGTVMVKDIAVGQNSGLYDGSNLYGSGYFEGYSQLTVLGSYLYFTADDGTHGKRVWVSDGTSSGTQLAAPTLTPDALSSAVMINRQLFFPYDDGVHGTELWKSNPYGGSANLVKDIKGGTSASSPYSLVALGSNVYFFADNEIHCGELWVSDGSTGGTRMVKDVTLSNDSSFTPYRLTVAGDRLYFLQADSSSTSLWCSDGSEKGTYSVKQFSYDMAGDVFGIYGSLVSFHTSVYFGVGEKDSSAELWSSDGTISGTQKVKSFGSQSSGFCNLAFVDSTKLYLSVNDTIHGYEPWISDGSSLGTRLLKDIAPGVTGSSTSYLNLLPNGNVLLVANDQYHGNQLYASDQNRPPVLTPVVPQNLIIGGTLSLKLNATDPDPGQTVTYFLDPQNPAGVGINSMTGGLTFRPTVAGDYRIAVNVCDNGAPPYYASTQIQVHVQPALVHLVAVKSKITKNQITGISVQFDSLVDAPVSPPLSAFKLVELISKGFGKYRVTVLKSLAISGVTVDTSGSGLSLLLKRKLSTSGNYQLMIDGSGVRDTLGRFVDGGSNGVSGSKAVYKVTRISGPSWSRSSA